MNDEYEEIALDDDEMQELVNVLITDCHQITRAASMPQKQPGLYKAWKDTRGPKMPLHNDPIVYIELLAQRVKETIRNETRELKTGKLKAGQEEPAAYDVWLQTFCDIMYIANMLTSEHPEIISAMKPLRDEPVLAHLLIDLAGYFNDRVAQIWTHPDAPEICDYEKEKRGIKTSRNTEH